MGGVDSKVFDMEGDVLIDYLGPYIKLLDWFSFCIALILFLKTVDDYLDE